MDTFENKGAGNPQMRYHSVVLDKSRCLGCTNCHKHCPSEAIRVRGGRAHILSERCIDCGECIRICDYHAMIAVTDPLEDLKRFPYTIALPSPALYSQFKNLEQPAYVLEALKQIGFTDVFDVAIGADAVARAARALIAEGKLPTPVISSACPTVIRLIQMRFPDLLPNILPLRSPAEVAAQLARAQFCEAHGCAPEEVGCFFITPCPAQMTAIRSPIGQEKSALDGAISILDVYGLLLSRMKRMNAPGEYPLGTRYGINWGMNGGIARAIWPENSLTVDGVEDVSHVLEEIENHKLDDLVFLEASACVGGCAGGPLTFENNYVAKTTLRKMIHHMPKVKPADAPVPACADRCALMSDAEIKPNDTMKLDENVVLAMQKMRRMNQILDGLPGYDCGSCGSPTCRTFAEDIVLGYCGEMDCIHLLKNKIKLMAQEMVSLAQTERK